MKRYFPELEALRGYMALWVAVGHALNFSGIYGGNSILNLLVANDNAVKVFIILSGFVISHLLLESRESYATYLTRRFFRLFPAYIVCCAFGWMTADWLAQYASSASFLDAAWAARRVSAATELEVRPLQHAVAHLVMLHGAIPYEFLPEADRTILPPAWSISLEWQFYLVAPLALMALRSQVGATLLLSACLIAFIAFQQGWLGTYFTHSTLPAATFWFAIGIASRFALPTLKLVSVSAFVVVLAALLALAVLGTSVLALSIWVSALGFALFGANDASTQTINQVLFLNPLSRYLGKISYSLYLAHLVVMTIAAHWMMQVVPGAAREVVLGVMSVSVLASIGVAAILHTVVELNGIRLGKWLISHLSPKAPRTI
jgi:peptidoglycan/LPS O-acetylase OafA/YrhL